MPRRLISFEPAGCYHLYNRGVNRRKVFFDDRNYQYFLFNIERYLLPISDLIAYCLMPNHYHVLIQVKETSEVFKTSEVSTAMMKLSVSYTKAINKGYNRVGPLFQGAFQAKHIDTDAYLWQLIGYIHLNPVAAGLVQDPSEWVFSSYHDYLDLDPDNFKYLRGLASPRL